MKKIKFKKGIYLKIVKGSGDCYSVNNKKRCYFWKKVCTHAIDDKKFPCLVNPYKIYLETSAPKEDK